MSLGAKALQASAEAACPGAPLEQSGGHDKCHRPVFQAKEQQPLKQCKATASNVHATMKHQQKPNADEQKHALVATAICPSLLAVLQIDLLFQIPDFQK